MSPSAENTLWESLRRQHTAPNPDTPPAQAMTLLGAFKQQTEGLGAMDRQERLQSTPGVQDATIALLICGFTPVGGLPQDQETAECLDVALNQALPLLDVQFKMQFLQNVVFNVSFHGFHEWLAPAAMKAFDSTTLETVLLEHARSENELHLNNAVHFASFLPAVLSQEAQDELMMIIRSKLKNQQLHPIVRESLRELFEEDEEPHDGEVSDLAGLLPVGFISEHEGSQSALLDSSPLQLVIGSRAHPSTRQILEYLTMGSVFARRPGWGCDKQNGSRDILTDGTWAWPAYLSCYIERHNVILPTAFLAHMARNHWKAP